jgi:hypothetical protein
MSTIPHTFIRIYTKKHQSYILRGGNTYIARTSLHTPSPPLAGSQVHTYKRTYVHYCMCTYVHSTLPHISRIRNNIHAHQTFLRKYWPHVLTDVHTCMHKRVRIVFNFTLPYKKYKTRTYLYTYLTYAIRT